jgi:hypothetical protein
VSARVVDGMSQPHLIGPRVGRLLQELMNLPQRQPQRLCRLDESNPSQRGAIVDAVSRAGASRWREQAFSFVVSER